MTVKTVLLVMLTMLVMLIYSAPAGAEVPAPGFTIDSFAVPTHFSASENADCRAEIAHPSFGCDSYEAIATNSGSQPTTGPITLTDTLPAGVTMRALELKGKGSEGLGDNEEEFGTAPSRDCGETSERVVRCTWNASLAPDGFLKLVVYVTVNEGTTGSLVNSATVSGGGGVSVSTEPASSTNEINAAPAPFGASHFESFISGLSGARDTQAGGHPYELVTTFDMDNAFKDNYESGGALRHAHNIGSVRDIVVDLPLGFAGSTLSAPECTLAQMSTEQSCPASTIVGHLETQPENFSSIDSPIYNLVPENGHPAEFGYLDFSRAAHVISAQIVPSPRGYVIQTSGNEIPEVNLRRITIIFYGNPAVRDDSGGAQVPFFTNPSACANGPLTTTLYMDSWQNPGSFYSNGSPDLNGPNWVKSESVSPPVSGCNAVGFAPELKAQPTTHEADSPTGLEFELSLAQNETFGTLATPALKNAVVTLPEGVTIDPSAADGLGVCSEAQIGFEGPTLFDFDEAQPACPESSKIGSLELESPLIPRKLYGEIFLASQNENPYHSTFAAYAVVDDLVTGILIKFVGEFKTNPVTGQTTATFDENPQLPFSNLKLHFFGGPRAELATPLSCGLYTTTGELTPWSFPDSGPLADVQDTFAIDEACATGFKPNFIGGSTNLQGGEYTSFQASFSREDDEPEFGGLTVSLPPGLLANVGSVPQCSEAQIHETEQSGVESCPVDSQIGTVQAGAGPGPDPLFVPGKVFLTGPYNGGPYGLAVVVPAKPGPFNFGLVVVRQSLRIDPLTAAVTDVSDPFPSRLDPVGGNGQTNGIPIRLRRVDVEINRPGFAFNPTDCEKLAVGGAITSTRDQNSNLAVPFQVTNCATLGFKPTFKVTTSSKASRAKGTGVTFQISYPKSTIGKEAWFRSAKFDIPKQLPARLSTLQKSCPVATFQANPAACQAASRIGTAIVHTQVLPVPLQGPVYFVSSGGSKFPEAVIVLQGDGVTIDIHGETFINEKTAVTSATFRALPDTPFQSITVTLPAGPFSEFTAVGNICKGNLKMPTAFIAANGDEIHQNTPINVTGCPKAKKARKAKRKVKKTTHKVRKDGEKR